MPHTDLWTFQASLPGTREALVGSDVEARDGSIGKVDEATPDTGRAYIVVDTVRGSSVGRSSSRLGRLIGSTSMTRRSSWP